MRSRSVAALIAACVILAACSGSPTGSLPAVQNSNRVVQSRGDGKGVQAPVADPTKFAFTSIGASSAKTFTVTVQFAGPLSAVSSDTSVATVSPSTATPVVTPTGGGTKSATFTVTPVRDGTATITVTDKKGGTATVVVTVTTGPAKPDASVYVQNASNGSIVEYAAGNYTPPPALTLTALESGWTWRNKNFGRMTFDSNGNLWGTDGTQIFEFAHGASASDAPIRTITPSNGAWDLSGIAVDRSGNVYVSEIMDSDEAIYEFGPTQSGVSTPIRTIQGSNTGFQEPSALMTDASGDLWVMNIASIEEFAPNASGNVAPLLQWRGCSINGAFFSGFAFDPNGNLVVIVSQNTPNLRRLKPPFSASECGDSGYMTWTASGITFDAFGDLSIDNHGYMYALAGMGIYIYSENTVFTSGGRTPYAAITGSNTGFSNAPRGLAIWTDTSLP